MSSNAALRNLTVDDTLNTESFTIQITGDVPKPGTYPIKGGSTLLPYLHDAGVAPVTATQSTVIIIRSFGADKRSLIYPLDEPDRLPRPKPGDLIIVNHLKGTTKLIRDTKAYQGFPRNSIGRRANTLTEAPPPADRSLTPAEVQFPADAELLNYAKRSGVKRLLNLLAERQAATGAKSFAVMSPRPSDGRTFFTAAIAMSYALLLDSKVLILDCSGTDSSALLGRLPDMIAFEQAERSLDRASVIVRTAYSLRRNPKDDIDFALRNFITEHSDEYDLILLDTAPIFSNEPAIDPVIAAAQSDGALVVLRQGSQEQTLLENMNKMLKQHHVGVVGVVTNAQQQQEA